MIITGLQHHNGDDKIILKRLGHERNITVILSRKDKKEDNYQSSQN